MNALPLRGNPDGGRLGRVPGRVGQEVGQHLDDAAAVGHHPGQIRRQVDLDGVPAFSTQEHVPGLFHQAGHLRRLGADRQRARLDATRIQQIVDQAVHVIGLLIDDAEELLHHGRVRGRRRPQRGGGRALDGGQRNPEFVAHHTQELGPQPLQLLQWSQVLKGDDHGLDRAVLGTDRRGVEQRRDTPAVGDPEDDLLGAYRGSVAQHLRQRKLSRGELLPVAEPAGHDLQQLLRGLTRCAQTFHDSHRLPIERYWLDGLGLHEHHAHRRGLDQDLQVGPSPLLVPVRAGVGDGRRRLRCEQHQGLVVRARELLLSLLPAEKEVADLHAPMTHGRPLDGLRPHQVREIAERGGIIGQISQSQRSPKPPQILEDLPPAGPVRQPLVLFRSEAGRDELLGPPRVVEGRNHAVAGAGQRAGAVHDLAQDGADVEGRADTQDGGAQPGDALPQRVVFSPQFVVTLHLPYLVRSRSKTRCPVPRHRFDGGSGAAPRSADGRESGPGGIFHQSITIRTKISPKFHLFGPISSGFLLKIDMWTDRGGSRGNPCGCPPCAGQ